MAFKTIRNVALAATILTGSAAIAHAQTSSTLGAGGSTAGGKSGTSSTVGAGGSASGTTGLDNADKKAGDHGAQGRMNAREKQEEHKK